MTPDQIKLVQTSFEHVIPIADTAAALFYGRLFELDPSLRQLFRSDLSEQGHKLMATFNLVVTNLHRLEALAPAIRQLGERHRGYGVADEHYVTVGTALLWTLEQAPR